MDKIIRCGEREIRYSLARKSVKNINIRIKANGVVSVSASKFVPVKTVESFLLSKSDWIFRALDNIIRNPPKGYFDGKTLLLLGETVTVSFLAGAKPTAVFENGALTLTLKDLNDEKKAKKVLDDWLSDRCTVVFNEISERAFSAFKPYGIEKPLLKTRVMKSRWGSCNTASRVIILNKRLIFAPLSCIEYVIVHEYAHLIQPNHSAAFHVLVKQVLPDYKVRRRLLRDYVRIEM